CTIFKTTVNAYNRLPPSPSKLLECSHIKGLKALGAGLVSLKNEWLYEMTLSQRHFSLLLET
ncbi:hypothetical protein, partial [Bacillus altitudinis]|uniref:hypothetical protein n=1 Tax=Bacillus altitudinis TaxID=293387 RepID=UPI001C95D691